jgi:hypothetical protein
MKQTNRTAVTVFGGVALVVVAGAAQATVLSFDDLVGDQQPILNGYGGLQWNNMYFLNGSNYQYTGYYNGIVSPNNVAFNGIGDPAAVSDSVFTFNGAWFTAAWNDGLTVQATGYRLGTQLFQKSIVIDTQTPVWFEAQFAGIDTLTFSSSGGTNHGYGGSGTHFAMDDFTYNSPVPLPAAGWLFGSALTGLALRFKRRRAV